ncbi:hypothetical protein TRFO_40833 [Tritrichomonas foetus]|uniref:Uncharacterized protein n=1 Tax=Tritrichomonas foetus TaxID=1144522 RepID=A0A1J4J5V6_9EUKA|nr:hypothetical protein TRFO_40833 [Tritrichomonas foetus]|eukprot:OHS92837.1 hypothetical protein TRFO_40833 [Tritrichomonas foetus]
MSSSPCLSAITNSHPPSKSGSPKHLSFSQSPEKSILPKDARLIISEIRGQLEKGQSILKSENINTTNLLGNNNSSFNNSYFSSQYKMAKEDVGTSCFKKHLEKKKKVQLREETTTQTDDIDLNEIIFNVNSEKDDLISENCDLKEENYHLLEENDNLRQENEQLIQDNFDNSIYQKEFAKLQESFGDNSDSQKIINMFEERQKIINNLLNLFPDISHESDLSSMMNSLLKKNEELIESVSQMRIYKSQIENLLSDNDQITQEINSLNDFIKQQTGQYNENISILQKIFLKKILKSNETKENQIRQMKNIRIVFYLIIAAIFLYLFVYIAF